MLRYMDVLCLYLPVVDLQVGKPFMKVMLQTSRFGKGVIHGRSLQECKSVDENDSCFLID